MLELARYIVLNPVRAGMVRRAEDWPWSSYRATRGMGDVYEWLQVDWLLSGFARRRKTAYKRYQAFLRQGKGQSSPWESLKNQVFLGDEKFVSKMQCLIDPDRSLDEILRNQKRKVDRALEVYEKMASSRDEAIYNAFMSGAY